MSLLLFTLQLSAQVEALDTTTNYWKITGHHSIRWNVSTEKRLPHHGNIEMAGANVAAIVYYELDEECRLSLKRDLIFPQLRTYNQFDEPAWRKYRAYFRRTISNEVLPSICKNNNIVLPKVIDSVEISGKLIFYHQPIEGLMITRTLFPSMEGRYLVEEWELKNLTDTTQQLSIANSRLEQSENGYHGTYAFVAFSDSETKVKLAAQQSYRFPVYYGATLNTESSNDFSLAQARTERDAFLREMQQKLVLKTPDLVINTLFYFSKIRAAESIFNSSMGKVHSPGGGNYYVGIWANDQVEYSGPFFPYLGYKTGNEAAYNTYRKFANNQPTDSSHIAYAFEVDGNFPMLHLDRGDAAMIAYGTSQYLLARGDRGQTQELWPLVEWSLAYCHRMRNEQGAIQSESDEMEGRIETGTANLSTSALYYGGLKYANLLALELGLKKQASRYGQQQKEMADVIENYFGAELEGLSTYKYFTENQYLRHWICLPLTMGINRRAEGTLAALFGKLWTENGILVEYNPEQEGPKVFWDRGTLYAFRGAFKAGAANLALDRLEAFSNKRLLGNHVPYVVEAYPENNMKHLSAESALYCRVLTEGLLGIEPSGFGSFWLTPQLPDEWNEVELTQLALFGRSTDVAIRRQGSSYQLDISCDGQQVFSERVAAGKAVEIGLGE